MSCPTTLICHTQLERAGADTSIASIRHRQRSASGSGWCRLAAPREKKMAVEALPRRHFFHFLLPWPLFAWLVMLLLQILTFVPLLERKKEESWAMTLLQELKCTNLITDVTQIKHVGMTCWVKLVTRLNIYLKDRVIVLHMRRVPCYYCSKNVVVSLSQSGAVYITWSKFTIKKLHLIVVVILHFS